MEEQAGKQLALAQHYLSIGQPARTLEILSQAGDGLTEDPDYWYLRGRALYDLERYSEARQTIKNGLAQTPEHVPLLYLLCKCEAELGDLAAAEQAILTGLHLNAEDPLLLCTYALLVARTGQLDKANRLVKEATRVAPEDSYVAHARLALAYLSGNDRQTFEKGRELLSQEPEDIYGHYMIGNVLLQQGNVEGARHHIQTAVRLDPMDPIIIEAARHNKYVNHWLLWPLRPAYRLGSIRLWVGAIVILLALQSLGFSKAAGIFALVYFGYCVYSWVVPPLLRWWLNRSYR